jgi:hypothetical protein
MSVDVGRKTPKEADVKRRIPKISSDPAGRAGPITPRDLEPLRQQNNGDSTVGRRALLTRGGVVAAGVVGAGVAGAAVAGTANAATGDPVLQGDVNTVGTNTNSTEVTAANSSAPTPTVVLTNTGSTAAAEASPSLRLTPAAATLVLPASASVGGDMVATNDGELWFTHAIAGVGNVPAIVHTDANSNSFAPLGAPHRILDTRTAAGRVHVLDRTGKFDSIGRLLAGKTIHIDLTSLVSFGEGVTANLTVLNTATNGFVTLWSGAVSRPNVSSINFGKGAALSNLTVSGIAQFGTTTDTIAIFTTATTQVLLDVAGFNVADFGQVNGAFALSTLQGAARAERARQALAHRRSLNS